MRLRKKMAALKVAWEDPCQGDPWGRARGGGPVGEGHGDWNNSGKGCGPHVGEDMLAVIRVGQPDPSDVDGWLRLLSIEEGYGASQAAKLLAISKRRRELQPVLAAERLRWLHLRDGLAKRKDIAPEVRWGREWERRGKEEGMHSLAWGRR